jgi:hypothetical protein
LRDRGASEESGQQRQGFCTSSHREVHDFSQVLTGWATTAYSGWSDFFDDILFEQSSRG